MASRVSIQLANFEMVKFGGGVDGCDVRWAGQVMANCGIACLEVLVNWRRQR